MNIITHSTAPLSTSIKIVTFITVMFGCVGFSLPYPVFGPMFLAENSQFFSASYSESTRMILLGLTLALYPCGQFLGSPLAGRLSDQYGRKKILSYSLLLVVFCYSLIGYGITKSNLGLILIGLFTCGLCESNVAIVQATVADLSSIQDKPKNFGLINVAINVGWIIGPLLGGKLADASLLSWFTFATPFYSAALFGFINLILVTVAFPKTATHPKLEKTSLIKLLTTFITTFKKPHLRFAYSYALMGFLSVFFYFYFFSPFMVEKFAFGPSQIANFAAYLSLPLILGNYLIRALFWRFDILRIGYYSHFFLALSMIVFMLTPSPLALWLTIIPVGLAIGITETSSSVLVSNSAGADEQGSVMGTYRSLQVLSEMIAALLGGLLASVTIMLPFIAGACFASVAALILITRNIRRK